MLKNVALSLEHTLLARLFSGKLDKCEIHTWKYKSFLEALTEDLGSVFLVFLPDLPAPAFLAVKCFRFREENGEIFEALHPKQFLVHARSV